ncbi:hypothetical protein B0H14DRAFT_3518394 [Mycena olivaceomarginata]|nr:hypothetical protein B0H14DRAFT_3518394 [Mycena olivaceomarginata]
MAQSADVQARWARACCGRDRGDKTWRVCAVVSGVPQPGKNLPVDGSWRNVPRERRFLYALFLAIDANFRMKRRDVSSEEEDPSLGDGVAFFARVEEYMQHLEKHWNLEQEKSTCVAHDAVDEPDREARGTASSGIHQYGLHAMEKPEHHDDIVQLYISYDIVCQWHKNVWQRLAQPMARPERGWANANPLASSTKEMGPGARRDALDDHFNDWNHKKIWGWESFAGEVEKKRQWSCGRRTRPNPNPFKVTEKHEGVYCDPRALGSEGGDSGGGDAEDDLEKLQRDLAFDSGAIKLHATDRQKTALQERSNKLGRKVNEWLNPRVLRTVVATLRAEDDQALGEGWISPTPVSTVAVKLSHARFEFELRVGHAHAALEDIRRLLLVRTGKYKYKDRFERARGLIPGRRPPSTTSTNVCGERPPTTGSRGLLDDIRQPGATFSDPQHKQRKKKRKRGNPRRGGGDAAEEDEERPASWIWRSQLSAEEEEEGLGEALRIEWAKTRARAYRWTEEVDLVEEEMRRVGVPSVEGRPVGGAMEERLSTGVDEVLRRADRVRAAASGQDDPGLARPASRRTGGAFRCYIALGRVGLGQVPQDSGGRPRNQGPEEEEEEEEG